MVPSLITITLPSIAAVVLVIITSSSDTDGMDLQQYIDVVRLSYHSKKYTYNIQASHISSYINQVGIFLEK